MMISIKHSISLGPTCSCSLSVYTYLSLHVKLRPECLDSGPIIVIPDYQNYINIQSSVTHLCLPLLPANFLAASASESFA